MSEPLHTPLGARLRERTQPLAPDDERYDYAHAHLCEALNRSLEQVAEVFDPAGDVPPLAPILDLDLCPGWALPWLAQLVGVWLPAGVSDADARELVRNVSGFERGTPASLQAAASLTLTGNKTVTFRERDGGNAYALEVVTLTGETPDPVVTERALRALKPGGIVLRYRTVEGQDWQGVTAKTWRQARIDYASWRDLRDNV